MISLFHKTTSLSVVFLFGALPNSIFCCPPESNLPVSSNSNEKPPFANETPYLDSPSRVFQRANDYEVLIMGGGYSPSGNQFSLESNVKYFLRIKEKLGFSKSSSQLFFADGNDPARDLQYFDPKQEIPLVNRALAEIFGKNKGLNHHYRSNQLQTNGPSSIAALDQWISRQKKAKSTRFNLVYFTGHGGKGSKKEPHNTTAYLWNNQNLNMQNFSKKLDGLPREQKTVCVMVQCYSGGFAHFMFKEGNQTKGLSTSPRAGFFATTHDRVAAGCTPDITESDYREYSTTFWEAICGETRMGLQIPKADYDKNGNTSLSEAHAYVVINSDTIDVPVKTSEIWLRTIFSAQIKLFQKDRDQESSVFDQVLGENSWLGKSDQNQKLRKIHENILSKAEPEEIAVIRSLALQFGFSQWPTIEEADEKIGSLKQKRKEWDQKKNKSMAAARKLRDQIKSRIRKFYPELVNPYHPKSLEVFNGREKELFLKKLNFQNQWQQLVAEKENFNQIEKERFALEKEEVKGMRLKRSLEYIYLWNHLQKKGSLAQKRDFNRLVKLEKMTFPLK